MEHVVTIQWTEAGDYLAWLPEIPGCAARGDTVEEAERNLRAAFENYVASVLRWEVPDVGPVAMVA
jgi:predicted RNase H-like HicB family nuclease